MSINKNILIFFIFCLIFINLGCKISKEYFDINEKFDDEDEYEDESTNEAENVDDDSDCKDSDDKLEERPSEFSINNCIDCMQFKLCQKYQKRLCGFENSKDATKYLIDKCKNYCTENTGRRYGVVTEFNKQIAKIGLLKDALCKKFK